MSTTNQPKLCVICKSPFSKDTHYSYKQWAEKKCCSTACKRISQARSIMGRPSWNRGKRGWQSNNALTAWRRAGGISWNSGIRGLHLSPSTEFTPDRVTGPKNVNWEGGVSAQNRTLRNSRKHREWSRTVYARDNWRCTICKIHCQAGNIIAHHIKPFAQFPAERFVVENGVTLCRPCHARIHNPKNRFSPTPTFGFRCTGSGAYIGYVIGQNI